MAGKYLVFTSEITIDSSNDTIDFKRGTTPTTATLSHGTFYLYGDGSEDGDFVKNVVDALEAVSGSVTYSAAAYIWPTYDRNLSEFSIQPSVGQMQFFMTGSFDMNLLGFSEDSALAFSVTSDSSCPTIWMSDQPYVKIRDIQSNQNFNMHMTKGGIPYFYKKAVERKTVSIPIRHTQKRRTMYFDDKLNQLDSFENFYTYLCAGNYVKVLIEDTPNGVIFEASTGNLLIGGVLDIDSMSTFAPTETGVASGLFNWDIPIIEVKNI